MNRQVDNEAGENGDLYAGSRADLIEPILQEAHNEENSHEDEKVSQNDDDVTDEVDQKEKWIIDARQFERERHLLHNLKISEVWQIENFCCNSLDTILQSDLVHKDYTTRQLKKREKNPQADDLSSESDDHSHESDSESDSDDNDDGNQFPQYRKFGVKPKEIPDIFVEDQDDGQGPQQLSALAEKLLPINSFATDQSFENQPDLLTAQNKQKIRKYSSNRPRRAQN